SPAPVSRQVVVIENPERCAVEIVILAAAQRPQEREQPGEAKAKSHRQEIDEHIHVGRTAGVTEAAAGSLARVGSGRRGARARSAFSVTRTDDPDMAAAAISGVTSPAIAIGMA